METKAAMFQESWTELVFLCRRGIDPTVIEISRMDPPIGGQYVFGRGMDENANNNAEAERIFAAAQILCGNLDDSLNDDERRGNAILDLLIEGNQTDDDDDRATKRIKKATELQHEEPTVWPIEKTRLMIREFQRLVDSTDTSTQRPVLTLPQCWLGVMSTSSPNTTSGSTPPSFTSLFQNALISMAHLDIAAGLIDQSWDGKGNFVAKKVENSQVSSSTSDNNMSASIRMIRHIELALEYWPTNSSALILAANVDRMRGTQFLQSALTLYRVAMKCAHSTCFLAQQVLDEQHGNVDVAFSNDEKFLAETVLCQSAQEDDDGVSQVLVTASYMSAMLASCLGQHDLAADSLRNFASCDIPVTRIHPNVWDVGLLNNQTDISPTNHDVSIGTTMTQGAFSPCVFHDAISPDLLNVLRFAFRSTGPYWKESGYNRNIYYSYWTDYPLPRPMNIDNDKTNVCIVGNAVEHYIVEHLLPRVRSVVGEVKAQQVQGFEWWVHTRPHGANLGHQLHFDTDEALLEQDGTLESPIAATVTYLTLHNDTVSYGATMLFDQTPQSKTNADKAYICFPKSRSLLVFPGDLLHGVLPCIATVPCNKNNSCFNKTNDSDKPAYGTTEFERLTFMVNFWGYRIPDRVAKLPLYGPSGPMPPPTQEHTWVHDICHGYPLTIQEIASDKVFAPSSNKGLVAVSPAWDIIHKDTSTSAIGDDELRVSLQSALTIPASGTFQQRFFVTNAPDYFYSQLFEE